MPPCTCSTARSRARLQKSDIYHAARTSKDGRKRCPCHGGALHTAAGPPRGGWSHRSSRTGVTWDSKRPSSTVGALRWTCTRPAGRWKRIFALPIRGTFRDNPHWRASLPGEGCKIAWHQSTQDSIAHPSASREALASPFAVLDRPYRPSKCTRGLGRACSPIYTECDP